MVSKKHANNNTAFLNCSTSVNWVTDFFRQDVPSGLYRHLNIYFYHYNSFWERDANDGERRSRLGRELYEAVASILRKARIPPAL